MRNSIALLSSIVRSLLLYIAAYWTASPCICTNGDPVSHYAHGGIALLGSMVT